MIKNILFDMGQVLLKFDRDIFLNRLNLSKDDKKLLLTEIYLSDEWIKMDLGALDEPEAESIFKSRLPRQLLFAVNPLVSKWDRPLLPIDGMYELAEELKNNGYKLYLLSNASRRQHEYWPRLPVSDLFCGTVISADIGIMKPNAKFYDYALNKFRIKAEESFFIDDREDNIEGAALCGIKGTVFNGNVKQLRQTLYEENINIKKDYD